MGLIGRIFAGLFGGGRNVVAETAEVFRVNAEANAQRQSDYAQAALAQFGTEFQVERKGRFDRFMDGLNRLPRPLMVVATFALFSSAMFDPIWFAERMQGLALVPEPLWWLAGTIVAFYFGGRFQVKAQEFQQSAAQTAAMVPQVMENITRLRALRHDSPGVADTGTDTELTVASIEPSENPAVQAWRESCCVTFDIDTILKLASFGLSIAAMIYAFFVNRRKDVDERFREGSKRMDRHENRIAAIEQTVQTMPGKDDMHSLQLELVKQTGSLNEMRAVMEGNAKIMARLEAIVSRHEDHLLEGGKVK